MDYETCDNMLVHVPKNGCKWASYFSLSFALFRRIDDCARYDEPANE